MIAARILGRQLARTAGRAASAAGRGGVQRLGALRRMSEMAPISSSLSSILLEEIVGEEANTESFMTEELEDLMAKLAAKGVAVTESPGNGRVSLALPSADPNETVVATFDCRNVAPNDMYDGDGDDQGGDEDDEQPIEFDVKVVNAASGDRLVFECLAGAGVQIDAVAFYKKADSETNDDVYDGPKFDELDARVQAAFHTFLEDRHVDADLCNFIYQFAAHKENLEYLHWLKSIQGFVKK
ncbi:mitochondrial glycoprotein [Pelagophyceae sp. CCMP2097]|nr:mitochondrial glycoprotein [Pelagophyceae sp. CCMP2097]